MTVSRQDDQGNWVPAEPIPMRGWKARTEQLLYRLRLKRLGMLMGKWDERGLGR